MGLVLATLGQVADLTPKVNPKLSRRPQNQPRNPIINGQKRCAACGETKDAYRGFSWQTRARGRKAPRDTCRACRYLKLKEYRSQKCGK